MKECFDNNWLFSLGDFTDAQERFFDDTGWRRLNIPHDWSIEGKYDRDCETTKRGAFLPMGIAWYRKRFNVDKLSENIKVSIHFDAIYNNASIYINGIHLGTYPNGYLGQKYDITPFLTPGENVLAVRVDNKMNPSSRWYSGAGIYRHAWINKTEMAEIDTDNVFAITDWRDEKPVIRLKYGLSWRAESYVDEMKISVNITSPDGTEVLRHQHFAGDGKINSWEVEVPIENPILWDVGKPNLYTFTIKVFTPVNLCDEYVFQYGLRHIDVTADTGLSINGKNIKVKGVCLHHDAGPLGAAVPAKVWKIRLQQLQDMGCNAIRTGHKPMAPEFYDICDQLGVLVLDEIYDGWHAKAPYDYGALHFEKRWKTDVRSWVQNNRNHACIFMWSIGNETGRNDVYGITPYIHNLDPTRLVTGGEIYDGVDVSGFNGKAEPPGVLDRYKSLNSDRKILLTEFPHALATRGYYRTCVLYRDYSAPREEMEDLTQDELFSDYSPGHGPLAVYNSSYDNHYGQICARNAWRFTRDRDYVIGQFIWTGFDYLGESYGWPMRYGNHGVFDLIGIPKDIYYFYKSEWTDDTVLHILPHWTHKYMEGKLIPVWIYTNCETVELFLNDVSFGRQHKEDKTNLEWRIPYQIGTLKAVGVRKGTKYIKEVHTATVPAHVELKTDTSDLTISNDDIAQITAIITDASENLVPYSDNRVYFGIYGPAYIQCLDNGDPANLEPHRTNNIQAFYGICKAFVRALEAQGGIIMTSASFLGDTFFEDSTTVSVDISQVVLRAGVEPVRADDICVYFTCDGTPPTQTSTLYTKPFIIHKNAVIRGLAVLGDRISIYFEQEYIKGIKHEKDFYKKMPLSRKVIGRWKDEKSGDIYNFKSDGFAELCINDKVVDLYNWWYDSYDDYYADCTGQPIDPGKLRGELNYTWWYAKLSMPDSNTLLLHERKGNKKLIRI